MRDSKTINQYEHTSSNKNSKKIFTFLKYTGITIIIAIFILCFVQHVTSYTEYTYNLSEIENDKYAIYYQTHSRTPSENYEVVILCCNGNICTFEGSVTITYTDETPYVYIKDVNLTHGDEINVYLPTGSVKFEQSVNIGK